MRLLHKPVLLAKQKLSPPEVAERAENGIGTSMLHLSDLSELSEFGVLCGRIPETRI